MSHRILREWRRNGGGRGWEWMREIAEIVGEWGNDRYVMGNEGRRWRKKPVDRVIVNGFSRVSGLPTRSFSEGVG
jgi:hypothetical protein